LQETRTGPSQRLKRALPYLAFATLAVVWVFVQVWVGRFMATDEIAFKAPGREWAASGRFAAPELEGFLGPGFRPSLAETYGIDPPLFPMLFGVFSRAAGFGSSQNVAFDAIIHLLFATVTILLARRLGPELSPKWAVFAGLAVLLVPRPGRPEELVGVLGSISFLPLVRNNDGSLFVTGIAGASLGLAAFAGPVAGAALALSGVAIASLYTRTTRLALETIGIWATSAMATFFTCSIIFFAGQAGRWSQFYKHASRMFRAPLLWGLQSATRYAPEVLLFFTAGLLVALAAKTIRGPGREGFLPIWMAWLGPVLLLLFLYPGKPYYLWALAPTMAATTSVLIPLVLSRRMVWRSALCFGAATLVAVAGLIGVRGIFVMASLPVEQQLGGNERLLRDLIPDRSMVLGNDFWPSLAGRVHFISSPHSDVPAEKLDFVLLTANGSGKPGKQQKLEGVYEHLLESRWEIVYDGLTKERPRFLGLPLSRSAWGYGFILYRRTGKMPTRGEAG
jgi:hypothetical protein